MALPERKPSLSVSSQVGLGKVCGWNSCLAEVTKLGPLYTHPDAGEVEQLRASEKILAIDLAESLRQQCSDMRTIDTLRAQLAERDALLAETRTLLHSVTALGGRKIGTLYSHTLHMGHRIAAALSASAEPGAPVERDEQTDIELAAQAIYETWSDKPGYVPWQAGGNSEKQGDARLLAHRAAAKLSGE